LFHIDFILQVCDPMFVGCPIFGAFHPVPLLNLLVFKSCIYRASKQTRTVRRGAHFGHEFELTLGINRIILVINGIALCTNGITLDINGFL
jgi:hypothetical protein